MKLRLIRFYPYPHSPTDYRPYQDGDFINDNRDYRIGDEMGICKCGATLYRIIGTKGKDKGRSAIECFSCDHLEYEE